MAKARLSEAQQQRMRFTANDKSLKSTSTHELEDESCLSMGVSQLGRDVLYVMPAHGNSDVAGSQNGVLQRLITSSAGDRTCSKFFP